MFNCFTQLLNCTAVIFCMEIRGITLNSSRDLYIPLSNLSFVVVLVCFVLFQLL